MYLIGIGGAWLLLTKRVTRDYSPIKADALEDLIFYGAMGVILGGRLGYIIFYNFSQFIADPLIIFKV
jgi:phosphatidylglycerol:prolipoprotein diacylglycerol transferase